jgi:hypothetical protein
MSDVRDPDHGGEPAAPTAGTVIAEANRVAVERLQGVRPLLVGVARAGDVVPGLAPGLLLHAGPPIEWERASGPLRGAAIGALLYEGMAGDEGAAEAMLAGGEIALEPCHHHGAVGPMAGVLSPSMTVWVVADGASGRRAFSNLNEGYGKVLRYGAYAPRCSTACAGSTARSGRCWARRSRPASRSTCER